MIEQFSFQELSLKGAFLVKPFWASDERGCFIKDYNINTFQVNGIHHELKEVFFTCSHKGVIRAIHFQRVKEQAKLVRCISGHIYDVIIDLRKESSTFGQWLGFDLTGENRVALYVPEHFGHGYLVMEESIVCYQCNEVFFGEYDSGIKWDDPVMGIKWPLDCIGGIKNLIISEKDKSLQSFSSFLETI